MSSDVKNDARTETPPPEVRKKRIQSMSDEEIIQGNLKELLEKKSREERKANGRLGAVIVAFLVIFLAVYHVWIRKTAGFLVSAVIMIAYGAWVVLLAIRDKRKKALFEKHLEEVALKNKLEFEEKARAMAEKTKSKSTTSSTATLHFEDEIGGRRSKDSKSQHYHQLKQQHPTASLSSSTESSSSRGGEHRKHRKHRRRHGTEHGISKDLRVKRPSIRQKLFRQNVNPVPSTAVGTAAEPRGNNTINTTKRIGRRPGDAIAIRVTQVDDNKPAVALVSSNRHKKLQRMNALIAPQQMVRMNSAP